MEKEMDEQCGERGRKAGEMTVAEEVERALGRMGYCFVTRMGDVVEWDVWRSLRSRLKVRMEFADGEAAMEFWETRGGGCVFPCGVGGLREKDEGGVGDEEDKGGKEEAV